MARTPTPTTGTLDLLHPDAPSRAAPKCFPAAPEATDTLDKKCPSPRLPAAPSFYERLGDRFIMSVIISGGVNPADGNLKLNRSISLFNET